jgi:hypothetical protein
LRAGAARLASATVDGRAIDLTRYKGRSSIWSLGYVLPPDDGFVLELSVRGREPLELDAIARSLGLPAAVSAQLPPRPPGVEPVHAGDQTVVHRQIRL